MLLPAAPSPFPCGSGSLLVTHLQDFLQSPRVLAWLCCMAQGAPHPLGISLWLGCWNSNTVLALASFPQNKVLVDPQHSVKLRDAWNEGPECSTKLSQICPLKRKAVDGWAVNFNCCCKGLVPLQWVAQRVFWPGLKGACA